MFFLFPCFFEKGKNKNGCPFERSAAYAEKSLSGRINPL
ncbi:hypothetical protein MUS_3695 [Bacillus velezensis YAU B9601-Y2]|uniref:Uncharacterized protein n=1 Tax=Bacillus amyloliquefaciens (strain Y2) TaxID=1155777 RepID=I2CA88_BACAY|nr:hypothetical protein MUS_3695 [Bacillus velezensis YAU B9601-Y2]